MGWETPSGLGAVVRDAGGRPEARERPLWYPGSGGPQPPPLLVSLLSAPVPGSSSLKQ